MWLATADTHLTDRPKDDYRFGLFPWLRKQQQKHGVIATFLLGDLTDKKDNHSSILVNRIIDELFALEPPVYILKGNHDFISRENPFFKFLNYVDGFKFINEPTYLKKLNVAMIPHMPDQAALDDAAKIVPPGSHVMLHQSIQGAIAETGAVLTGLSTAPISARQPATVWAGDIHKPQALKCGAMYLGAPYRVRFGDDFTPRVLLFDPKIGQGTDLHYPCLNKWSLTLSSPDDLLKHKNLKSGDQIKISIELLREEAVEWAAIKQRVLSLCKDRGLEVFGIDLKVKASSRVERLDSEPKIGKTTSDIFDLFCKSEGIASNIRAAGSVILKG